LGFAIGVPVVQRIIPHTPMRQADQRINTDELGRRGIVVAVLQVVEARLTVLVLARVEERVGRGLGRLAQRAIGAVGVGGDDAPRAAGDDPGAAQLVLVVVVGGAVYLLEGEAVGAEDVIGGDWGAMDPPTWISGLRSRRRS
jgi:hypothetical protein